MNDALQQRRQRQTQMPREILGLIKAALIFAPWMQGHGHDEIGVLQDARSRGPHQRAERRRYRSAALILQRMDDFLHAPVIAIDRARPVHALIGTQAIKQRRCKTQISPAVFADRAVERMKEWFLASRARRLEQRCNEIIRSVPPRRRRV